MLNLKCIYSYTCYKIITLTEFKPIKLKPVMVYLFPRVKVSNELLQFLCRVLDQF